jgi:hypothetical protein
MAQTKNNHQNGEKEKQTDTERTGDRTSKGSAFNEKPLGSQHDNTFGETKSVTDAEKEKDLLTGEPQRVRPLPDADV